MRVLSLFDGIGGARQALKYLGITPTAYFASEVDKFCIKCAEKNFSDIIQVGDVRNVKLKELKDIDLLIGGSPCQSFSRVWNQKGFEIKKNTDLFFEFVLLKNLIKPKFWIFENTKMKKESLNEISKSLGVMPREIDGGCWTAQRRKRLFWSNIGYSKALIGKMDVMKKPKDLKKLVLSNVILDEKEVLRYCKKEKYNLKSIYMSESQIEAIKNTKESKFRKTVDGRTIMQGAVKFPTDLNKKAQTILRFQSDYRCTNYIKDKKGYRILLPLECERLMGFPEEYTSGFSLSRCFKMLGNSFIPDVIVFFLMESFGYNRIYNV